MTDEEFSAALGFKGGLEKEACLKIRHATAAQCRLDPDLLTPTDDTGLLNGKTFDGWDNDSLVLELEQAFPGVSLEGVRLPNFTIERFFYFYNREKPTNYGEWVKKAVQAIMPVIVKQSAS